MTLKYSIVIKAKDETFSDVFFSLAHAEEGGSGAAAGWEKLAPNLNWRIQTVTRHFPAQKMSFGKPSRSPKTFRSSYEQLRRVNTTGAGRSAKEHLWLI